MLHCTVFDSEAKAGGFIRSQIPRFRLPESIIDEETGYILDLGSVATFTGVLDTIDPSNGKAIRVPVISVRTTKAAFQDINLERVEKVACLRNLGAHVSGRPDELQAVKPIVEFDMVDKRFIEQADAISSIEQRPNLLEMTPSEFEALVANLFGKMGLDTKLTRTSRDGENGRSIRQGAGQ